MDRFTICQAFMQLEADYNVGGWLQERPSNQRRKESIGVQLHRMNFDNGQTWVDIDAPWSEESDDCEPFDADVREIYWRHVLAWNLPIDAQMMANIKAFFAADYVAKFPQCAASEYLQG